MANEKRTQSVEKENAIATRDINPNAQMVQQVDESFENSNCSRSEIPLYPQVFLSGTAPENAVTAILQGRLGSTRLPKKVLLPLIGKPVIQHVYERILHCRNIDKIIVATSMKKKDDPIAELFERLGVPVFRGSEEDPLDRYYQAATQFKLKHIVRIMGDCPLVDPEIVDEVIAAYLAGGYDFCWLSGDFPVGLDTTIYTYDTLKRCWKDAAGIAEREHIFPYITNNSQSFNIGTYKKFDDRRYKNLRWTMDHASDYEFIKAVYEALYQPGTIFLTRDILALIDKMPHLVQLNSGISRDEGLKKSMSRGQ